MNDSNLTIDWQKGIYRGNDFTKKDTVKKFSILIVGDLSPTQKIEEMMKKDYDGKFFGNMISEIKSADFAIFNLESPLSNNTIPAEKLPVLIADPLCIYSIANAGFNIACLANNHIMDFGESALNETIKTLQEQKIKYVGAGKNLEEACKPLIVKINKSKIGIINIAEAEFAKATSIKCGACDYTSFDYIDMIKKTQTIVDLVIVIFHGGKEYVPYPLPHIYNLFNEISDLGVPLIVGHHPHVPQGILIKKGSFLSFSLGNFLFDIQSHKKFPYTQFGYSLKVTFTGNKLYEVKIIPYTFDFKVGIKILQSEEKEKFLNLLKSLSDKIKNNELINAQADILADMAISDCTFPVIAARLINASSKSFFSLIKNIIVMLGWLILKRRYRRYDLNALLNILTTKTHRNQIIRSLKRIRNKGNSDKKIQEELKHTFEDWKLI